MDSDDIPSLIFTILSVLFFAFLSLSEAIIGGLGWLRIRRLLEEADERHPRLEALWNNRSNQLALTVRLAKLATVMLIAATTLSDSSAFWLANVVAALVLVGVVLPTLLADIATKRLLVSTLHTLYPFYVLFYPMTSLVGKLSAWNKRIFGDREGKSVVTEDDIEYMLDVSGKQGVLEDGAHEMISGVFDISEMQVKEVMVPRTDMIAISQDISKDELLDIIEECGYSRIPVYEETLDNIRGILYTKDVVKMLREGADITEYMKQIHEALFVPETKWADDMLRELQRAHLQMAVVVDEYGGVAGIVTMEDILEQIVGDIWDEHDDTAELITKIDDTIYKVNARTTIYDLYEYFQIEDEDEERGYDTVGGLVYSLAGEIPQVGDKYDWRDFNISVSKMDNNRVEEVELVRNLL
ncbi:hypothetical protein AGMMS49941_06990 [Deferribacterales bacterium]|nr:hypothetical protein AGMMS49941_06990 [Deferribacterales bacterium]